MTISSEDRQTAPTAGNGVWTEIDFDFKVFVETDVLVTETDDDGIDSALVEGTDYTVTLNANQNSNPGGTVTLSAVSVSGYTYTVSSNVPYTQAVALVNLGGFFPTVINAALDRLTALVQQVLSKANRSLRIPVSDGANVAALPTATLRANTVLGFDGNGNPIVTSFADIGAETGAVITAPVNNDFLVYDTGQFVNKTDDQVAAILAPLLTGSYQAKVSSNDTTAGYLNGKLVASTAITFTENNNGSNETLSIAVTLASQAEAEAGAISTKAMTPLRVKQAIAAQVPALVTAEVKDKASVYHNTTQSIANGTETVLAFNAEDFDTGGWHDNATNNSRITVDFTGYVRVIGQWGIQANTTNHTHRATIYKNGSATSFISTIVHASGASVERIIQVSGLIAVVPGDYIELSAWHNYGSSRTAQANTTRLTVEEA